MSRLKSLFSMPLFESNDTARLNRLLTSILRVSLIVLGVGLALMLPVQAVAPQAASYSWAHAAVLFSALIIFLTALVLQRLQQVQAAAIFLPLAAWILVTFATVLSGGVSGQGFVFYIVVVMLASTLLGFWAGAIFFTASFIASLGILYVEANGLLPLHGPGAGSPLLLALTYWLAFFWTVGLIHVNQRDAREMLLQTRQKEQNLLEINRELNTARASLENYARALERRVVHLQVAAEIAREAASLDRADELLERSVNLVRDRFGFYHAGIFLVEGDYAVLRAATGEAGERMLANRHRLKVGQVGIVGYVTGKGQPRIALDVGTDVVYFRNPHLPETRSEMAVPLQVGSRVIGALDVQSKQANAFHSEDIAILQTLADQLAVAIENARLYEAAQRRLDELSILHTVALAAAESASQDELIERATQLIGEKLYPNNFGFLLLDPSSNVLRFHHSYRGLDEKLKQISYPLGQGVIGRVAAEGRALRVSEVTRTPMYIDIHAGMQSELCVPLKIGGQVIGVINAEHTRSSAFTEADERLLLAFSGQLATAIEKARLFDLATRRAVALEALRQAGLQLTSNLEIMSVFEAILEHAIKLVGCDSARIYRYDGEKLTFGTALWAEGIPHRPFAAPRPNGLTYTVARTAQRMVVSDVTQSELFADYYAQGALVGLPLRYADEVIGVMNIVYEDRPHHFDDFELHVLEMLADQAAIALTNAQLFADAQERAQALAMALSEREELDRLKDELIQNISHELRTPVAIIRGYADLLEKEELGTLKNEQRDAVSVIARRITLLGKIVEDLTTMMETEAKPTYHESVQLVDLIKRLIEDFQTSLERANLTLSVDLPDAAPPVQGNTAHLTRLVDNLLGNALKFTPSGGTIGISLVCDGSNNVLQVRDSGVGIPPDKLSRIFDRFYQVDGSTTRRYGGAGLGLALVKEIAAAHGGEVSVESTVGSGSTFTVTLPVEAPQTRIFGTNET
ncbi:MAG: GAF domain-containing protein [Chloroflexota bacterium]